MSRCPRGCGPAGHMSNIARILTCMLLFTDIIWLSLSGLTAHGYSTDTEMWQPLKLVPAATPAMEETEENASLKARGAAMQHASRS